MKTTKKSLNDMPQTKTKTKLLKVNAQLNNLDKEITNIQNELNISRSFSADNLFDDDVTIFPEKQKGYRLYKKSVEVMNKRAENVINEEESIEYIPQKKRKIHIEGYKPPSERIFDVNERKMKLMKRIQEENERRINDDCTFKPKINRISKEIEYDRNHLIQPKRKENSPNDQINKNKKKNNEMPGIGIYERQIHKNIYHQPEVVKGNVLSPTEEKNMIERLTKPKEDVNEQLNVPQEPKNYATKQGTIRLIARSIRRCEPDKGLDERPKHHMNKKSKEITRNTKVDLYEEYLDAKERVRQKNAEVIEWRKLTEKNENRNHEPIRYRKIRTDLNPTVAGMDDYVDRMKKIPVKKEEDEAIPRVNPGIIIVKPFDFDIRDELKKSSNAFKDDDFLAQISDILKQV